MQRQAHPVPGLEEHLQCVVTHPRLRGPAGCGEVAAVLVGERQATDGLAAVDGLPGFGRTQWERVPRLPGSSAGSEAECATAERGRPRGLGGGASNESWQPRLSACSCAARDSSGR